MQVKFKLVKMRSTFTHPSVEWFRPRVNNQNTRQMNAVLNSENLKRNLEAKNCE